MQEHDDFDGPTPPMRALPPDVQAAQDRGSMVWKLRELHQRLAVTNMLLGAILCALVVLIWSGR